MRYIERVPFQYFGYNVTLELTLFKLLLNNIVSRVQVPKQINKWFKPYSELPNVIDVYC